jgi:hypothetical protein
MSCEHRRNAAHSSGSARAALSKRQAELQFFPSCKRPEAAATARPGFD